MRKLIQEAFFYYDHLNFITIKEQLNPILKGVVHSVTQILS
jgi:hypothetical protein